MKKLFFIFLSTLISLAMILSGAATVIAESGKEVAPQPAVRAGLIIRAPSTAEAGKPVTITVFTKYNSQPVAGAEVYAFKIDKMATRADKKDYTSAADFTALVDVEGVYLGYTNTEGKIIYKFADAGRYILVAFKSGFMPAFSRIDVALSTVKSLYIKAPALAEAGDKITLAVFEMYSNQPVAKVAVYARKIVPLAVQKPKAASIFDTIVSVFKPSAQTVTTATSPVRAEPIEIAEEVQNAEEVQKQGILLGYTDDNGRLTYTFTEAGNYVLAAIKKDYAPGFARIKIASSQQKALGIKAPGRAEVNQTVTITVFEMGNNQTVSKAGVYALRLGDLPTPVAVPAEKPTALINTSEPAVLDAAVNAETVKVKGIFLGFTDEKGQISSSFDKIGRYALAAVKDGYQPGFARIQITPKMVIPHKIDVVPPTTGSKAK